MASQNIFQITAHCIHLYNQLYTNLHSRATISAKYIYSLPHSIADTNYSLGNYYE